MSALLLRFGILRRSTPLVLLLVLLQRTPVMQFLVRGGPGVPTAVVNLLRTALLAATGAAAHTLTGATTFTSSPTSPASATTGTAFSMAFAVTGAPSTPKSYKIAGTLPPGLSVTGASGGIVNASTGSITGTPTTAGGYTFTIQAWEKIGATGEKSPLYSVTINVTGTSATTPSITTQPSNASVTAGGAASFSVVASGTAPLTYQWRKDGASIAGATSASLALSNVQSGDTGTYSVVVSNSAGSATSNGATLTVSAAATAPSITTHPSNASVTAGGAASFSVTASGTAPLTYQWRKDGASIAGATSASLALSNVQAGDAGTYSVVVSNSAGSATSNGATLTVSAAATAPSITTQPSNVSVTTGGSASFSVVASGTAPLTYQWRKDGASIAGATSASLALSNVQSGDAGTYSVVVSNSAGSATSNGATLTVSAAATAPSITTQPSNVSVTTGGSASFSVVASGTAPLTYQWRKDGASIAGATSASLALSNVQSGDAGTYSVVVSNSAGSATSNGATLTVSAAATAPSITTQPNNVSVTTGGSASFSVVASGTAPLTYQWRKDGASIAGATSASLALSNVQSGDAGTYSVVVSNSAGSATSNGATLTVSVVTGGAPTITSQPQTLQLPAGYGGTLTVGASGGAPLTYQWSRNGSPIAGATGASYTIANAQPAAAGDYSVTVSNASGSVTSTVATLTVGTNTGKLAAISVRAWVGSGNSVIIPGIAVSASSPKTILIRAVGPGLVPFGVPPGEVLADPTITVYAGQTVVAANDDWENAANAAALPAVFRATGNFELPAGSKDAVALVALPGGVYTAVIAGKNGGTGVALVEVYEVN